MLREYLKHLLIRTPLEQPLQSLRRLAEAPKRRRHPELAELYAETDRIRILMRRVIGPSSHCIDVGAHLGSVLSFMIRLAPKGRHIAVEPLPLKAQWLRKKFPEVDVQAVSLSDASGELTFFHNLTRSGYSSLLGGGKEGDRVVEIRVPCETLDGIVRDRPRVDFVKIDVEGAELKVFGGALETLRRHRPVVVFECTQDGLKNFGFRAGQVWECLSNSAGYEVYVVKDLTNGGEPLSEKLFEAAMAYPFRAFNFVGVPKGFELPS